MEKTEFIGQIQIKTDAIRITDPCYERGTWCCGYIDDTKTGTWEVSIKTIDSSVGELHMYHVDIKKETLKKSHWIEQEFTIGVDSGQCVVIDDDIYPIGDTGEYGELDTFYGKCCDLIDNDGIGLMDRGVVCSSGYGDGTYTCYTLEEKGKTVGVKVIFIEHENYENIDEDVDYLNYEDDEDEDE